MLDENGLPTPTLEALMSNPNDNLRVPILMVPFENATITNGVLRIAGPVGVKFPPRLPFESEIQVAIAIENPSPVIGSTAVRIALAGPGGAVLPESVRNHTVRWRPGAHGGPVFNYIIDDVPATFTAQGAHTVQVFVDDNPLPRAATSFGVFLQ
jgi:hypothetical protein